MKGTFLGPRNLIRYPCLQDTGSTFIRWSQESKVSATKGVSAGDFRNMIQGWCGSVEDHRSKVQTKA